MRGDSRLDFGTRARIWAGILLLVGGLIAVVGSTIDWVTVEPPPKPPPGADFEGKRFAEDESSEPFTGLEARDGWVTAAGGGLLLIAGLLAIAGRGGSGLALLASIPIGAVAISAYRGVNEPTSPIMERTKTVGDADPALGLVLIAAAAGFGLIAAAIGVAATPKRVEEVQGPPGGV